jgi:hypothetical protein
MFLLGSVNVGAGGTTAIVFDAIPQTYTDLVVMFSLRSSSGGFYDFMPLYFNSNGSNYSYRSLIQSNNSAGRQAGSGAFSMYVNGNGSTANTFSHGIVTIPDYAGSRVKSYSIDMATEGLTSDIYMGLASGLWSDTAAITRVSIQGTTILQNSTAYLYGRLKGVGGATVA